METFINAIKEVITENYFSDLKSDNYQKVIKVYNDAYIQMFFCDDSIYVKGINNNSSFELVTAEYRNHNQYETEGKFDLELTDIRVSNQYYPENLDIIEGNLYKMNLYASLLYVLECINDNIDIINKQLGELKDYNFNKYLEQIAQEKEEKEKARKEWESDGKTLNENKLKTLLKEIKAHLAQNLLEKAKITFDDKNKNKYAYYLYYENYGFSVWPVNSNNKMTQKVFISRNVNRKLNNIQYF